MRAKENGFQDIFVKYIPLDNEGCNYVILSELYVYWKRNGGKGGSGLWGREWRDLSHVVLHMEQRHISDRRTRRNMKASAAATAAATDKATSRSTVSTSTATKLYGVKLATYGRNSASSVSSSSSSSSSSMPSSGMTLGHRSTSGPGGDVPCGVFMTAESRSQALALYQAFVDNAMRMGNPTKILPPEVALDGVRLTGTDVPRFDPRAPAGEWGGHYFGMYNGQPLPEGDRGAPTETALLHRAQEELGRTCDLATLDREMWFLVAGWRALTRAHRGSVRCCAVLVLNHSQSPIRLTALQLTAGRDARILGTRHGGYDSRNRRVLSGGSFTVFAAAFPSTPLESGRVRCELSTSAFSATISCQSQQALLIPRQGFKAGFLEKSAADDWARYVLVVV